MDKIKNLSVEEWSWMEMWAEGPSMLGPVASGLGQISTYPKAMMSA